MFQDERVLITGASSGIGRALARRLAGDGAKLMLVARRRDRLEELKSELGEAVLPDGIFNCDLSDPTACDNIMTAIHERGERVDMLVNNAGAGEYGEFCNQDLAELEAMMRLNMISLTRLTKLVLPGMIARRHGRVVNIASTAAYQPTPYMGVYGATKSFVQSFSLSLWYELRKKGIKVTCICPGPVNTEFFDRGGMERQKKQFLKTAMSAEAVAEKAYEAIVRGRCNYVPGAINKIGAVLQRFAPLRFVTHMTARLLKPASPV